MTNQRINDVDTITTISGTDKLLVNTDVLNNVLEQIKKDDFVADIISTDVNNLIEIGTDNKLIVELPTNVTTQGNTFNGANQLVQKTSDNKYPAGDGSLLTGITAEEQNLIPFSVNSGKIDSDGNPDLLDITDTSKVVFNVSAENPIKGTLADGTLINRTSIDDLSVTALDDGIYNLFVGESGEVITLANTIYRQRKEPTGDINLSIIGTPTINIGDISGFTSSNYVQFPSVFKPGLNAWEIVICFTTASTVVNSALFTNLNNDNQPFSVTLVFDNAGKTYFSLSSNGSSNDINSSLGTYAFQPSTKYWVKMKFTGTTYTMEYSTNGTSFTLDKSITNSNAIYQATTVSTKLGVYTPSNPIPFNGVIHSGESYIKVNNEYFWKFYILKENDIWLNTSIKPYQSKKYNGTIWEDFNYIPLPQTVTVASGAITAKTLVNGYNINEWDEQIMLPDYNYPTTLTNGASFTAPVDGWVKNSTGMFVLYRGSSYTPASTGFNFYPMKGVA